MQSSTSAVFSTHAPALSAGDALWPPYEGAILEGGDAAGWVEDLDAASAAACIEPWRALAAACLEPNAFYEPDFALAAAALERARLRFLFVWNGPAQQRADLLAVVPLVLPRRGTPLPMARLWLHKNSTSAIPWLARAHAEHAWRAVENFFRSRWPRLVGLCIGSGAVAGPVVEMLRGMRVPMRVTSVFSRAVLDCTAVKPANHRTLLKCRRRLARLGSIAFVTTSTAAEVTGAIDAFLALEASGWKAGRGALGSRPDLQLFARTATIAMAQAGRCRIVSLELAGRPIAMGIVLLSGRRAFFWKIAYDEAHAAFSPGALLSLALTEALARDRTVDSADSCAGADHPMIDRLWPDRYAVGTCFVGLKSGRSFDVAVAVETLKSSAHARLKATVKGLVRRRR